MYVYTYIYTYYNIILLFAFRIGKSWQWPAAKAIEVRIVLLKAFQQIIYARSKINTKQARIVPSGEHDCTIHAHSLQLRQ